MVSITTEERFNIVKETNEKKFVKAVDQILATGQWKLHTILRISIPNKKEHLTYFVSNLAK